ncbi:MauE/DoxX family redox-associated membrane protein [Amycolatopsis sp. NPDC051102]|uniref:MauE/DoxX family redox-associated membrane protein n=1 Tax=Amycolatopsis sp. NPDC051102 TaxID=3155163 RepID=UPI00342AF22B
MNVFWPAGMTALTATGAILLITAGVAHALRPAQHRAVLRTHRLFPTKWSPVVAATTTGAELLVGSGVLFVLSTASANHEWPAAAQAALYSAFAAYAAVLRTRRAGVPCGCFGAEKVSWAVVARAVVLAAGSAGYGTNGAVPDRWSCVAAGVVLAMANHLLPAWRGIAGGKPGRRG